MRYNVASGRWALMAGRTTRDVGGQFPPASGIPGYAIEDASYAPGARQSGCNLVIDIANNNVFLFGGIGNGHVIHFIHKRSITSRHNCFQCGHVVDDASVA